MAKKSVDDRALNKDVFQCLRQRLVLSKRTHIVEVGGGIGTMIQRLFESIPRFDVDYTLLDVEAENLAAVIPLFSDYAVQHGLRMQVVGTDQFVVSAPDQTCRVKLLAADLLNLPSLSLPLVDGIIAHAVLDLLPLGRALPLLRGCLKADGWLYATINFDGLTLFEPQLDVRLDTLIQRVYHNSMDNRRVDGVASAGSQAGRKMFHALREHGFEVQAGGASDWFVFADQGKYWGDEAFFLEFLLGFVEDSVGKSKVVDAPALQEWLSQRRRQIQNGDLLLVTHQYDYFALPLR